jgi:hypothetical protein
MKRSLLVIAVIVVGMLIIPLFAEPPVSSPEQRLDTPQVCASQSTGQGQVQRGYRHQALAVPGQGQGRAQGNGQGRGLGRGQGFGQGQGHQALVAQKAPDKVQGQQCETNSACSDKSQQGQGRGPRCAGNAPGQHQQCESCARASCCQGCAGNGCSKQQIHACAGKGCDGQGGRGGRQGQSGCRSNNGCGSR